MTSYKFTKSVFDLAVISLVKWMLVFVILMKSEERALTRLIARKHSVELALISLPAALSLASLIYSLTKVRPFCCGLNGLI